MTNSDFIMLLLAVVIMFFLFPYIGRRMAKWIGAIKLDRRMSKYDA